MGKTVISIENIKRNFQVGDETVHALRGVSFSIEEGEFVTIMGTSGSGKSTLLNTLGCLDTPTSGEYYLDGICPTNEQSRTSNSAQPENRICLSELQPAPENHCCGECRTPPDVQSGRKCNRTPQTCHRSPAACRSG